MSVVLWIVAGALAAAYLFSGGAKLIVPKERLASMSAASRWAEDFSPSALKAIGTVEILGGLGLVLPAIVGVAPMLVPVAALGLGVVMLGAVLTRLRRHELRLMIGDLTYLALTAFVAWGRFDAYPFTS